MKNMKYMSEAEVTTEFLQLLQKELPLIRVFRRSVGSFKTSGSYVTVEKAGRADYYALYPSDKNCLHIEIEIKKYGGTQTKEQALWEEFIIDIKGLYCLVYPYNFETMIEKIKTYVGLVD